MRSVSIIEGAARNADFGMDDLERAISRQRVVNAERQLTVRFERCTFVDRCFHDGSLSMTIYHQVWTVDESVHVSSASGLMVPNA